MLPFESRAQCEDAEELRVLDRANGVFFTGGNQLRLSTILGGTSCARQLRAMNASGAAMAGTSAGAAFLSEHMIAFGDEGPTPRAGMVTLAPGLGLTNRVIVDQHFRQRDRLGRLLAALALNPFAVGIGLDEDTAAFIGSDEVLRPRVVLDGLGAARGADQHGRGEDPRSDARRVVRSFDAARDASRSRARRQLAGCFRSRTMPGTAAIGDVHREAA